MSLPVPNPIKIRDLTPELNMIGNDYKGRIQNLMKRFDFESTNDRSKCKHYPLDMESSSEQTDLAESLELMSTAFYSLLFKELQAAYVNYGRVDLTNKPFGARAFEPVNLKIGKLYMTPPARFSTVNTSVEEVQAFVYGYEVDGKYELMGEVNFGIEVY